MHRIAYATIPKDDDRVALLKRISAEVARKSDADDEYTGSLWRTDHWHDDVTYPSRQEAEKAIKDMDNGFYDDHAVLFYDIESALKRTKSELKSEQDKRFEACPVKWLVKYEYHC